MIKDFSKELPVGELVVNKAIRWVLDYCRTDCCYYGGMVGSEFSRGVDLDISGRDIFGYEEVE